MNKNNFLDSLFEPKDIESFIESLEKVSELNFSQSFVIRDIDISSRTMNHWCQMGLMPSKQRTTGSTFHFNFYELIWFHIVKELREYGYPISKINLVKEILLTPFDLSEFFRNLTPKEVSLLRKRISRMKLDNEEVKREFTSFLFDALENEEELKNPVLVSIMTLMVNQFIFYRDEVNLLIDANGIAIPIYESEKDDPIYDSIMADAGFDTESYIRISLNKFFRKFILDRTHFDFVRNNNILNENEAHILSLVREGKAKSITIRFKDQKPYLLEISREKKVQVEARLSEVLLKGGYEDISLKTANGNIVVSNFVTKEKLK